MTLKLCHSPVYLLDERYFKDLTKTSLFVFNNLADPDKISSLVFGLFLPTEF